MTTLDVAAPSPQKEARLSVYLIAGWIVLVIVGCVLAYAVHSLASFPGDLAVAQEIQEPRAAGLALAPLLRAASVPGNTPWVILLYVAAVAILAVRRLWSATILVALTATGDSMVGAVKLLVARARRGDSGRRRGHLCGLRCAR